MYTKIFGLRTLQYIDPIAIETTCTCTIYASYTTEV